MKNEETLALILEEINKKLDIIINEQKEIKEKIEKNHIIAMKRINKLQEYNEIEEMKVQLLNEHINKIARVVLEIEKRLY